MREISKCLKTAAFMMGAIFVVSGGCGAKKAADGAPHPEGDAGGGPGGNAAPSTGGTPGTDGGEGGSGPSGGRAGAVASGGAGGSGASATGGGGGGAGGMAGGCPTGTHILYTAPGCGTKAAPICRDDSGAGGACLSTVCGCDGKIRADGCATSSVPFAYFTGLGGMTTCDPQGGAGGGSIGGAGGVAYNNDGGTDACSVDTSWRPNITPLGSLCPTDRGTASCVPGTYCYSTIVCACGTPEFMDNFVCDCTGHFRNIGGVDPSDCFGPCPTGGRSGG